MCRNDGCNLCRVPSKQRIANPVRPWKSSTVMLESKKGSENHLLSHHPHKATEASETAKHRPRQRDVSAAHYFVTRPHVYNSQYSSDEVHATPSCLPTPACTFPPLLRPSFFHVIFRHYDTNATSASSFHQVRVHLSLSLFPLATP